MKNLSSFVPRLVLTLLVFGAGQLAAAVLAPIVGAGSGFIPAIGFAFVLAAAPVIFPEARAFVRSGAAVFYGLALSFIALTFAPAQMLAQVGSAFAGSGQSGAITGDALTNIFTSTGTLAAAIVVAVQFVRAQIWKNLEGTAVVVLAFVLGIGLALIGFAMHVLPAATWVEAIAFGAGAAVAAVGSVNLMQKTVEKAGVKVEGIPDTGQSHGDILKQ
ncbi:MAG: hypothetical protein RRA94_04035 [Bacteroidota bacterium]|nr:hypothetical protein [Bacteroidota bacterium]